MDQFSPLGEAPGDGLLLTVPSLCPHPRDDGELIEEYGGVLHKTGVREAMVRGKDQDPEPQSLQGVHVRPVLEFGQSKVDRSSWLILEQAFRV